MTSAPFVKRETDKCYLQIEILTKFMLKSEVKKKRGWWGERERGDCTSYWVTTADNSHPKQQQQQQNRANVLLRQLRTHTMHRELGYGN